MELFDADLQALSFAAHYALEARRASEIKVVRIFIDLQEALKRPKSQGIGSRIAKWGERGRKM